MSWISCFYPTQYAMHTVPTSWIIHIHTCTQMKKNTSLTIKGSNLETDSRTLKAPVKVNMGRTKNLEKKNIYSFMTAQWQAQGRTEAAMSPYKLLIQNRNMASSKIDYTSRHKLSSLKCCVNTVGNKIGLSGFWWHHISGPQWTSNSIIRLI